MTKKAVRGEVNAFVKGLITEASPLNFPEQAAKDIVNFEINKDGTIYRRLGFGYEPSFVEQATSTLNPDEIISYVWESPDSLPNVKFLVVNVGSSVRFYDLSVPSVIGDGFLGEVTLTSGTGRVTKSSFAGVNGSLVVASGTGDQIVISYSPTTGLFSQSTFRLSTRDIWGVYVAESDVDPAWRPTVDNHLHRYNLYNSSWGVERLMDKSTDRFNGPAEEVFDTYSFYPAEIDSAWSGVVSEPDSSVTKEVFREGSYKQTLGADGAPSKGYFILDLLDRGASRRSGVESNLLKNPTLSVLNTTLIPDDITTDGANVVCEHAGRAFYAGFGKTQLGDKRSPNLVSYVAFSQLVNNQSDLQRCYQSGDPTSREASDIIDTDGGLIRISGASGIYKLVSLGVDLIVFASNGVWTVRGGSDYGFTATNYKVDKLTDFGVYSPNSVVSDGSAVFYWGESGIYTTSKTDFGELVIKSVTEATIDTYYQDIDNLAKSVAKGIHDKVAKKIRWIYPKTNWGDFTAETVELVLDLVLGSFSQNKVSSFSSRKVFDFFVTPSFTTVDETVGILAGSDNVIAVTDNVVITGDVNRSDTQSIKYLSAKLDGVISYSIGWYNELSFVDWYDVDGVGVDAKAYLLTGAITAGDSSVHKQAPILVMHMERTEDGIDSGFELVNPSGCFARTVWDFASSITSNKFSPLFQVYRLRRIYIPSSPGPFDNGFELMTSRNKLRGRGRVLSLYLETEAGKDCRIVGWNLSLNGNSVA